MNKVMTREEFEKLVEEEFPHAIPERFRGKIQNVAFLIEEEVLTKDLLGFYHGIPATARGDGYGIGATLPDTITLYQKTIEEYATYSNLAVAQVVRDTIWHEVAHHFGYDEHQVRTKEAKRRSKK
ncbi:MAG: metallopeptidase family protein [bacterium]|nr:metallopeptidase family protein [bacterium]